MRQSNKTRGSRGAPGTAFMALAFLACTGCVMVPVPSDRHKHGSRHAISEREIAALVPGETTLTQALLRLGEPEYTSADETLVNFTWEKVSSELWIIGWWFDEDDAFHRLKHGQVHSLDLIFDAEGKLLKHHLTQGSFDEQTR